MRLAGRQSPRTNCGAMSLKQRAAASACAGTEAGSLSLWIKRKAKTEPSTTHGCDVIIYSSISTHTRCCLDTIAGTAHHLPPTPHTLSQSLPLPPPIPPPPPSLLSLRPFYPRLMEFYSNSPHIPAGPSQALRRNSLK